MTVTTNILKIAIPAIISSMLGQVTYVINMVQAGQLEGASKIAGLGLGHSVTQCFGIMVFLGLNSSLATEIS